MKVLKNRDIYNFLILLSYILFFLFLSFSGHYRIFVKKFYFPYILIGTLILFSILLVTLKRLKTFRE
ncbi:MAG: hypothetical protein NZ891_04130, partial [bacterium]|nr:hypothetical protein [bacterium]MDW8163911.1 hypothetical protein [Candidatus Omnitrophota bacterium]